MHGNPQFPDVGLLYLYLNPYLYCSCLMFWYRKIGHFPYNKAIVPAVVPNYNYSIICLWACFWLPISIINFHN